MIHRLARACGRDPPTAQRKGLRANTMVCGTEPGLTIVCVAEGDFDNGLKTPSPIVGASDQSM